jgi:CDGSH-type Zn-finger protein
MPNIITITPDGPYEIHGELEIVNREGQVLHTGAEFWMCRCGQSREKPFCSGRHAEVGFHDAGLLGENKLIVEEMPSSTNALRIMPNPNGSLRIQGPVEILLADGTKISGRRASLCRCGASQNKPFCDSTHKEIGFKTE